MQSPVNIRLFLSLPNMTAIAADEEEFLCQISGCKFSGNIAFFVPCPFQPFAAEIGRRRPQSDRNLDIVCSIEVAVRGNI